MQRFKGFGKGQPVIKVAQVSVPEVVFVTIPVVPEPVAEPTPESAPEPAS